MKTIDIGWNLDNTYEKLPEIFYTRMNPNPVSSPGLVIINESLVKSLGLNIEGFKTKEGIDILAGNKPIEGSTPIAQAYAGHQFGHFTMLGDGRAMLLGEQITPSGERFDVQLKGSGITQYSRGGDGRAGLGPMLREYIISEAMDKLGIPTSRSLAIVTTGDEIIRESQLDGAILTRISKSHIRVGTFEYASSWGSPGDLRILANYTIKRHFPKIQGMGENGNQYISLLKEVIKLQARLIAKWQLVGFIHGVMNTDNVSIGGETFDYGPCAFMDTYDLKTVFSSIDRHGRYAYGNQPKIGKWNLARFAETLLPLIHEDKEESVKIATHLIDEFDKIYEGYWLNGMRSKLGIFNEEMEDKGIMEGLLEFMERYKEDYTNTFVALTYNNLEETQLIQKEEFKSWYNRWESRLKRQSESKGVSIELMRNSNPVVIPRNHQVERALKAAVEDGDLGVFENLLKVLEDPYNYSEISKEYMALPKDTSIPYKTYCGT